MPQDDLLSRRVPADTQDTQDTLLFTWKNRPAGPAAAELATCAVHLGIHSMHSIHSSVKQPRTTHVSTNCGPAAAPAAPSLQKTTWHDLGRSSSPHALATLHQKAGHNLPPRLWDHISPEPPSIGIDRGHRCAQRDQEPATPRLGARCSTCSLGAEATCSLTWPSCHVSCRRVVWTLDLLTPARVHLPT